MKFIKALCHAYVLLTMYFLINIKIIFFFRYASDVKLTQKHTLNINTSEELRVIK